MNIPKFPSIFVWVSSVLIMCLLISAKVDLLLSIAAMAFCMVLFGILDEIRQNTKPNSN